MIITKGLSFILTFIFSFLLLLLTNTKLINAIETNNTITNREDCYQLANKIMNLIQTKTTLNEEEAKTFASAIFELENRVDCLDIVKNNTISVKSSEQLSLIKQPFIFIHDPGIALSFIGLKRNIYHAIFVTKKLNLKDNIDGSNQTIINIKPIAGSTNVFSRTLRLLTISKNLTLVIPESIHNYKLSKDLTNFIKKLEKNKHLDFCYVAYETHINIPRVNLTPASTIISCPTKHIEKSFSISAVNYSTIALRGQNDMILIQIYDNDPINLNSSYSPKIININEVDHLVTKIKNYDLSINDIKNLLKKFPNFHYTEENFCFYEDIKQNKEVFNTLTIHKKPTNVTCTEQAIDFINKEFQAVKNLATWIIKEIIERR